MLCSLSFKPCYDLQTLCQVLRMENSGPELHEPNYAPNDKNTGCEDTSIPSRTPPIAKIGASNLKEYPLQNIRGE